VARIFQYMANLKPLFFLLLIATCHIEASGMSRIRSCLTGLRLLSGQPNVSRDVNARSERMNDEALVDALFSTLKISKGSRNTKEWDLLRKHVTDAIGRASFEDRANIRIFIAESSVDTTHQSVNVSVEQGSGNVTVYSSPDDVRFRSVHKYLSSEEAMAGMHFYGDRVYRMMERSDLRKYADAKKMAIKPNSNPNVSSITDYYRMQMVDGRWIPSVIAQKDVPPGLNVCSSYSDVMGYRKYFRDPVVVSMRTQDILGADGKVYRDEFAAVRNAFYMTFVGEVPFKME
jgi:hypothetical protein